MEKPFRIEDDSMSAVQSLFFRAADRLRLEGYVAALTQDGMSLSLLSTDEAILDHYSKLLVERLRQVAPDVMMEVYFPASSEALLTRFNEALSNCSIQEAMDGKGVLASPRIWIVHDASALPDHEIQLLARLVQNFPGANIRVVLLMTVASNKQKLLNSFGRRILCWDIEPPTTEQAENMLAQARTDGREVAVRALLKKIKIPSATRLDTVKDSVQSEIQEAPPPQPMSNDKRPRASRANGLKLFLIVMSLLLISVLSVAIFHVTSQSATKGPVNWKSMFGVKNLIANEAIPNVVSASLPPAAVPVLIASSPVASNPGTPSSAPAAVVNSSPKPAEPIEVILPSSPDSSKAKIAEPLKDTISADASAADMVIGQSWVKKMPRGTFLVQHISVPSIQEANQWIQRHPILKNARVVATYLPNQRATQYAVVSGPFSSLLDATGFVENGGIPKDPMIRSARFMKEQSTPELADADAKNRKESRR